jgi:hypothetical protein
MIYGVLHKRNATHLWKMLYFQGLFWVLAAIMTELPSVVCLFFFFTRCCGIDHVNSSRFIKVLGFKNINGEST